MIKKLLLSLSILSCVSVAAIAQIHTDPNAPGNQRPTLLQSANGVPQVDITTPSAGGVSLNQFRQFDVSPQGVIINNGYQPSHTQLAGWVAANPWLAGGSASVIINQVNSTNPSSLQGYVEIAGNKADFILANPAGITCSGCGFLNAAHVQLATGKPQLHNGQLNGFDMGSGRIQIDGGGMDARDTNYAEILTRATRINAAIWANHLRITMAAKAEGKSELPPAPFYALDIARLGGMYAGKIWLIGTEHGLGVRNVGNLYAAGEFILTADGHIQNRGHIEAPSVTIQTHTLDNLGSGTIIGDRVAIAGKRVNNIGDAADAVNPGNSGNPSQPTASPIIAASSSLAGGNHD